MIAITIIIWYYDKIIFNTGPIVLQFFSNERKNNTCNIYSRFRSFPEISMMSWWKKNKRIDVIQNTDLSQTTTVSVGLVEKSQTIQLHSCSINYTYGLIVSNTVTTKKFYFNTKGIYNQTFYIKGTQKGWKRLSTGTLYRVSHYMHYSHKTEIRLSLTGS